MTSISALKHHFLRIAVVLSLSLLSLDTLATEKYATVADLISSQKVIRLYSNLSPNFGDQAATYNLMLRLKALHFIGHFELIYHAGIESKIRILYDLPESIPPIYEDKVHDITFLTEDAFYERVRNNEEPLIDLAMTGAHGGILNNANARVFLVINNFVKNEIGGSLSIGIWLNNQEHYSFAVRNLTDYVITPVSTLTDAKNYLQNSQVGQDLSTKNPALDILIKQIETQHINFMPIYGAPFKTYNNEQVERTAFPNIILQTIAGARLAQLKLNNKPLVIAVFFEYDKKSATLLEMMNSNNWGENEMPGAAHARDVIKKLKLNSDFVIGSISDPNTINKLKNLKTNQVMLLSMGYLPKVVFDGLYAHTAVNIWPQIREGASSLNDLIQTGRPHLRCGGDSAADNWEMGFDLVTSMQLKTDLINFYSNYCVLIGTDEFGQMKGWENNDNSYELLGNMIIESVNPHSALSGYFIALKKETEKPENDRIYKAFDLARETLNKLKS
jgi:hypothetical protein